MSILGRHVLGILASILLMASGALVAHSQGISLIPMMVGIVIIHYLVGRKGDVL